MATCKDCIHYEVCKTEKGSTVFYREGLLESTYNQVDKLCGALFKDKSRFVELPCKIGTELFRIKQINGKPFVTNTALNKNTFWEIVIKGEFGKTVFLTREEAEQALKERENSV